MYIHNTNSLPGSPEPMEPLERVSARLGSLASTQRRKTGGGPEQGDDDDDDDDDGLGGRDHE